MKTILSKLTDTSLKKISLLLLASGLSSVPLQAQDVVYVTAYVGGQRPPCPGVICYPSGTSWSLYGGSGASGAPGAPARDRHVYGYSSDLVWTVSPILATTGVYKIEIARPSANSTSPDVVVTATTEDGTLSPEAINSPVFQRSYSGNEWHFFAYITNTTTTPTITFSVTGGTLGPDSNSNRLNVDAFKFTEMNPCSGVAPVVGVGGPLVQGQTFVDVTGVSASATSVTVYADGSPIGELTGSIVAGRNTVPVPGGLMWGSVITARQTVSGCLSEAGTSGVVGSGANPPSVYAFLSLGKNPDLTGPIGAEATSFASTYTMKASSLINGSQTAPYGGHGLFPGLGCWETVTFNHAEDPALNPITGIAVSNFDPFAALDALVFSIDAFGPDSGPYDIYIDRIMNGDVVIEDFESYPVGTKGLFNDPKAATAPDPNLAYLDSPNSSEITDLNAFDGTKSCRIRWQFANNSSVRWARIRANATPGKNYPQIDTSKPITIRYLVLPVGVTEASESYPVAPTTQTKGIGDSVTFSVSPKGEGDYFYQWYFNGTPIDGATTSSYTKNNLQLDDSGTYSVQVGGSLCLSEIPAGLVVTDVVEPPTLNYSVDGNQITLTWEGSFTLQSKESIDDTWTDVTSSGSHQEALNSSTTKFFRLRQ